MTEKSKLIADIRYYENLGRTEVGNVRHQSLGTLYSVPYRSFSAIGTRFARKLREVEFKLPGFDHLYVVLTPALSCGLIELSPLSLDKRIRYSDVGVAIGEWQSLSEVSKHDHLVDLTASTLETYVSTNDAISAVAHDLKKLRSEIEIIVISKDTASYGVTVTLQIRPLQEQSIAHVTFLDKRSNRSGRAVLTKLLVADDIYPLCGSISVEDESIVLTPRKSFQASLTAKKYAVPFRLPLNSILP